MNNIYIIVLVVVCVCGAFIFGAKTANAKCRMQVAQELKQQLEQNIKNNRILNDKIYKTGLSDIRRILQSEYSIAE